MQLHRHTEFGAFQRVTVPKTALNQLKTEPSHRVSYNSLRDGIFKISSRGVLLCRRRIETVGRNREVDAVLEICAK